MKIVNMTMVKENIRDSVDENEFNDIMFRLNKDIYGFAEVDYDELDQIERVLSVR